MAACRVCGQAATNEFLSRRRVPVHQNVLHRSRKEALSALCGDLTLVVCDVCGFVSNSTFDETLLDYGPEYETTRTYSARFSEYVDSLVAKVIAALPRGGVLVEVGCGGGQFCERVVSKAHQSVRGVGFDPSYVGPSVLLDGRVRFEKAQYNVAASSVPADIVVCRHVIEHLSDPAMLVSGIRSAISARPGARLFLETPDVDWSLRNFVYWDFFYEHCSLFSRQSLSTLLQRGGLQVDDVQSVFASQYLWANAGLGAPSGSLAAVETPRLARDIGAQEGRAIAKWTNEIEALKRAGPVAVWGAGGKGVTFVHMADPRAELVDCLVDINPGKQEHYVPGTGHFVISPQGLSDHHIGSVIVLNPNYLEEISAKLWRLSPKTRVVDGMQWLMRGTDETYN